MNKNYNKSFKFQSCIINTQTHKTKHTISLKTWLSGKIYKSQKSQTALQIITTQIHITKMLPLGFNALLSFFLAF